MRRPFLFIFIISFCALGCKGQGTSPLKGVSPADYASVQALNEAQSATIHGAQLAFASLIPMTVSDSKLQATANSIRSSGCAQKLADPAEDYQRNWDGVWEVMSTSCPLYIHQSSSFNHDTGHWTMSRVIDVKSADLRKLNGLNALSAIGSLSVANSKTARTLVGNIRYTQFELETLGRAQVQIEVGQTSNGVRTEGSAAMTLEVGGAHVAAQITWTESGAVYKVNNEEADQKTFNEAFSSFELTEIMDRSLKMR